MENTKTTQLDSFEVRGKVVRVADPEKAMITIMNAWKEFWSHYDFKDMTQMPKAYYFDYEGDHTKPYSFMVGLPQELVKDIEGQETVTIPAQEYVVIEKTGEMPGAAQDAWGELWNSDINRAMTYNIEEYLDPTTVRLYIARQ